MRKDLDALQGNETLLGNTLRNIAQQNDNGFMTPEDYRKSAKDHIDQIWYVSENLRERGREDPIFTKMVPLHVLVQVVAQAYQTHQAEG